MHAPEDIELPIDTWPVVVFTGNMEMLLRLLLATNMKFAAVAGSGPFMLECAQPTRAALPGSRAIRNTASKGLVSIRNSFWPEEPETAFLRNFIITRRTKPNLPRINADERGSERKLN